MIRRQKAALITALFMAMFLAILYVVAERHAAAWAWYGWTFGSLGVATFTATLYRWLVTDGGRH